MLIFNTYIELFTYKTINKNRINDCIFKNTPLRIAYNETNIILFTDYIICISKY